MPTPLAPRIISSPIARTELNTFVRAHSTPQALRLRAHIVLKAADVEPSTNLTISHQVGCDNRTVGKWRRRYAVLGLPGLQDAMRSGRPKTITAPARVHVLSVASTLPQAQEGTVTRWTCDEIAATVLNALHTEAISRSSIFRMLLEADLQPHQSESWRNRHEEDFDAQAHRSASCTPRPGRPPSKAAW